MLVVIKLFPDVARFGRWFFFLPKTVRVVSSNNTLGRDSSNSWFTWHGYRKSLKKNSISFLKRCTSRGDLGFTMKALLMPQPFAPCIKCWRSRKKGWNQWEVRLVQEWGQTSIFHELTLKCKLTLASFINIHLIHHIYIYKPCVTCVSSTTQQTSLVVNHIFGPENHSIQRTSTKNYFRCCLKWRYEVSFCVKKWCAATCS